MSDVPKVRARLLAALAAHDHSQLDVAAASNELRRALLDFASETPDNRAYADRIEIGTIGDETGIKLRSREALFSDIAYALEDLEAPAELTARFPDMTDSEWAAFTRVTTLIYAALNDRTTPTAQD